MTTKSDLQKELYVLRERMEAIAAEIEAVPDGPWRPEIGDQYFLVRGGVVSPDTWTGEAYDTDSLSIGNVFRTREESEDRLFKLKIEQRLRDLAGGIRPEVGDIQEYIRFDNRLVVGAFSYGIQGSIPFSPGEAKKAIDAIGQADLKQYFEVMP